jgi:FMN phosphatase YigB (HAD superfamily)
MQLFKTTTVRTMKKPSSTMAAPPKTVVVLDFDGVILRNTDVHNLVRDRVVDYVHAHFGVRMMSRKMASTVNQHLYKSFGHTQLGLEALYANGATIFDFNKEVYNMQLFKEMDTIHPRECEWAFDHAMRLIGEHEMPTYLFTSAPADWCAYWLERWNVDAIPRSQWFTSSTTPLKPTPEAYEAVDSTIRASHGQDCTVWMMDDTLSLILPVVHRPNWRATWIADAQLPPTDNLQQSPTVFDALKETKSNPMRPRLPKGDGVFCTARPTTVPGTPS